MVYQVSAGYSVLGREIKVPQVFIPFVMRAQIIAKTNYLTDMINTLHIITPGTGVSIADCQAVAEVIDAWVTEQYFPWVHNTITYVGTHVRSMEGLDVPQYTISNGTLLGELGGDALPTYVSLPVKWTTGRTGHGAHGMFHCFPPGESENTGIAGPSTVYQNGIAGAMDSLMSAILAAEYVLAIASYTHVVRRPITGFQVRNFWGTVNSRKLEHGR